MREVSLAHRLWAFSELSSDLGSGVHRALLEALQLLSPGSLVGGVVRLASNTAQVDKTSLFHFRSRCCNKMTALSLKVLVVSTVKASVRIRGRDVFGLHEAVMLGNCEPGW